MKTHLSLPQSASRLFVLLLLLCLGCKLQEANVGITGIEVTQGIQNTNNTIPLIAERSTTVRAFLSTDAATETKMVTGLLTVTVDGQEITPTGGLRQLLPAIAQSNPDPDNEIHTLNFELPAPSGITESSHVDVEVTVEYVKDTDKSNNTFRVDDLTFTSLDNPHLLFTRVDYLPSGMGLPALSAVEAGVGDAMVQGIYPVLDSDPNLYGPAYPDTYAFSYDYNGNNLIDEIFDGDVLLSTLDLFKDLLVISGVHPLGYTFIYGWVNGSPMNGFGGKAPIGGSSGFGNTVLFQHQRSYAHELGHSFGLGHDSTAIVGPDTGWDTGARLENNPATNNTIGRIKSSGLVDIMNVGPPTDSTWVNTLSYSLVYTRMALETVLAPPLATLVSTTATTPVPTRKSLVAPGALLVQGAFNAEGTKLQLFPTLRLTTPAKLRAVPEKGIFTAVVTTDDGKQQRIPFDAKVCNEGQDAEEHGYFELQIPMEPDAKLGSVEIYHTAKRRKMSEWTASLPPSVNITAPVQGSQLRDSVTVRWTAVDPDTPAERLVYHLAYSPDGGTNWVAVAANLRGNTYTFPARQLPAASEGKGILKLYACEGLNTTTDQIEGLTGPDIH